MCVCACLLACTCADLCLPVCYFMTTISSGDLQVSMNHMLHQVSQTFHEALESVHIFFVKFFQAALRCSVLTCNMWVWFYCKRLALVSCCSIMAERQSNKAGWNPLQILPLLWIHQVILCKLLYFSLCTCNMGTDLLARITRCEALCILTNAPSLISIPIILKC